jgi:hypothetical protein
MILAIALFCVLVISAVAVAPRANAIMTNSEFNKQSNSDDDALGPIVPGLDNDIMTQHGDCTPLPQHIAC